MYEHKREPGTMAGQCALLALVGVLGVMMVACTPTVQVAAPKEPITVNLNVRIQHEIYVKVDRDVDELFSDKGLF